MDLNSRRAAYRQVPRTGLGTGASQRELPVTQQPAPCGDGAAQTVKLVPQVQCSAWKRPATNPRNLHQAWESVPSKCRDCSVGPREHKPPLTSLPLRSRRSPGPSASQKLRSGFPVGSPAGVRAACFWVISQQRSSGAPSPWSPLCCSVVPAAPALEGACGHCQRLGAVSCGLSPRQVSWRLPVGRPTPSAVLETLGPM